MWRGTWLATRKHPRSCGRVDQGEFGKLGDSADALANQPYGSDLTIMASAQFLVRSVVAICRISLHEVLIKARDRFLFGPTPKEHQAAVCDELHTHQEVINALIDDSFFLG